MEQSKRSIGLIIAVIGGFLWLRGRAGAQPIPDNGDGGDGGGEPPPLPPGEPPPPPPDEPPPPEVPSFDVYPAGLHVSEVSVFPTLISAGGSQSVIIQARLFNSSDHQISHELKMLIIKPIYGSEIIYFNTKTVAPGDEEFVRYQYFPQWPGEYTALTVLGPNTRFRAA